MTERRFDDDDDAGPPTGDLAGAGAARRGERADAAPGAGAGGGAPGDLDRVVAELTAEARVRAAAVTAETAALVDAVAALRPLEGRLGMTWRRWVQWQLGLTTAEARRICCLAEKLPALPLVDAAFRSGELSEGVTEVLARVATPANEAEVMAVAAKVATGAQLQQVARDYRQVRDASRANAGGERPDPMEAPSEASWQWDDDGRFRGKWNLRADDGATLEAALEAALAHLRPSETDVDRGHTPAGDAAAGADRDPRPLADEPGSAAGASAGAGAGAGAGDPGGIAEGSLRHGERMGARRSDALVSMADCVLADRADDGLLPESTQIILHHNIGPRGCIDADGNLRFADLPDLHAQHHPDRSDRPTDDEDHPTVDAIGFEPEHGNTSLAGATIPGCGRVPDWLAALLACDSLQIDIDMIAGFPVSAPITQHSFNRTMRRALRARDRHCRFPGCTRTRHLHAHHTKPWHLTRRTTIADAVLLCGQHHMLVHLRGYLIELALDHVTTVTRPDGTILRSTALPPPDPCGRPRHRPDDPPPDRRTSGTGEPLTHFARDVLATSWHLADVHAREADPDPPDPPDPPDAPGDDP